MALQSRCLCGQVTWSTAGPLQFMSNCHCSRCRKAHGVAFATLVAAPADTLAVSGDEHITRYAPATGMMRAFCSHCGSVVPGAAADGLVFLPAGNFLSDPQVRPIAHIFAASKAPWHEITDDIPRFDAYPPGVDAPVLPDPPRNDDGQVHGSCLCGSVAFLLTGEPLRAYNCHCTRCRLARSAAHASNLFIADSGFRFTKGADQLESFKVPDAERFRQVFCRTCGSPTPNHNPSRGTVVIPMGSLDDDPGIRPLAHIFVGSKAPWFEISGPLPQFEEYAE